MSHWNYRLVKYLGSEGGGVGIHEVYYDDAGAVRGWHKSPAHPVGNDEKDLRGTLMLMRDAFNRPVTTFKELRKASKAMTPHPTRQGEMR